MSLFLNPVARATNANNAPLPGALWYFYESGTLSLADVYTSEERTTPHANPVVANSGGLFAPIYLDPAIEYRVILKTSAGTTIQEVDPYHATEGTLFLQAGTDAVSQSFQNKLRSALPIGANDFGPLSNSDANAATNSSRINKAIATLTAGKKLHFPGAFGPIPIAIYDGVQKGLAIIPDGAHVEMGAGTWLTAPNAQTGITFFTPGGNNIFQVNIDGGAYPSSGGVPGTWLNTPVGIRAYATADYGLGADNVTVINSEIKNCEYGIRADGGKNWRIINNRIHRIKLSGVLFGHHVNQDTLHAIVANNNIEDCGDTAVAFFQDGGFADGTCAYNLVIGNTAKDTNQRAAGFAFDVERGGSPALQHHNSFIGNIVEQTVASVHQVGGFTIGDSSYSLIEGNVARGALGSNADYGIVMFGCSHSDAIGNKVDNFRAGGVYVDGCVGCGVKANSVVNCGGGAATAHSISMGLSEDCIENSVTDNTITIEETHPHYTAGAAAISVFCAATKTVRDVTISNNTIIGPLDIGIQVYGLTGTHATNFNLQNNRIIGRNGSSFFQNFAISMFYCDQVTITGTVVREAEYGFQVRDCVGVTLKDTEIKGATTLVACDLFTGTTGMQVTNRRKYVTITTAVANDGTGTIRRDDEVVPIGNYADDVTAAAGGVQIGSDYRNGSVRMRRVA